MIKPALLTALLCAGVLSAQKNPFAGRWDIDIKTSQDTYPDWMEVMDDTDGPKVRIQPRGGAVRPAVSASVAAAKMEVVLSAATDKQPGVTWKLTVEGDKLGGTQMRGDQVTAEISGVRAPVLKRSEPKSFGKEEALFNGKDLTGWVPVDNPEKNHWTVKDGELFNEARGANLKTTRKFDDFQLHIEFMCPNEHCNSGIYLRGRYEVQVGTEGGTQPTHEMGAIYGYTAPSVEMPMGNGEWQVMDITLVGRTVTVVRNGKKIHDHVELAGITGGALDSREGEPGPFFLQGDHTGGLRFRNIKVKQAVR